MTVETGAESLLIEVMGDEADAAAEDEESIEDTHLEVIFGFFLAEGTAVTHQVNEADSDTAIDVEDEVVFLGGRYRLNSNGIVKKLVGSEVLEHEFLNKLDTKIGIVSRLDSVANTGNF
jgi:hypothetical protein